MLVALALLSLISALLIEALRGAVRSNALIEQTMRESGIPTSRGYLRRLIAEARPIAIRDMATHEAAVVIGSREKLSLVSSHAVAAQYGGLYESSLELAPAGSGDNRADLIVRQRLLRPANQSQGPLGQQSTTTVLVRNVAGLSIRYFGRATDQGADAWGDRWTNKARLPKRISVDLSFKDNDPRSWPPLAIELELSGD